ncbi:MAG: hypothetical protein KBA61_08275 [Spirochaetes bacterium]|nr:hypothetical protein [Spirochaetota bacterium]
MKYLTLIIASMLFSSCVTIDITVRDDARGTAPKHVLLGSLENRVLDYNHFIVGNFRDSLAYEFFTRGYTVRHLPLHDQGKDQPPHIQTDSTVIQEMAQKQGADLVIQGTIFEARYGDAVEDRTSTAITLNLYNKNGALVGTARCITADTLTDADTVRALSAKLVKAIHSKLSNE